MGAASRRRGSRSRDELAAEDTEVCGGAGTASGAGKPSESSMWPRPRRVCAPEALALTAVARPFYSWRVCLGEKGREHLKF